MATTPQLPTRRPERVRFAQPSKSPAEWPGCLFWGEGERFCSDA
jgi:hypothetical protein